MMQLVPSFDGKYEVLFEYPGGWVQNRGRVVEAAGPLEAVAEACKAGGLGWAMAPQTLTLPIGARVRYEVENPTPGRCSRGFATRAVSPGGLMAERQPVFHPTSSDVHVRATVDGWRQVGP